MPGRGDSKPRGGSVPNTFPCRKREDVESRKGTSLFCFEGRDLKGGNSGDSEGPVTTLQSSFLGSALHRSLFPWVGEERQGAALEEGREAG